MATFMHSRKVFIGKELLQFSEDWYQVTVCKLIDQDVIYIFYILMFYLQREREYCRCCTLSTLKITLL
jgi:hypothetical protein